MLTNKTRVMYIHRIETVEGEQIIATDGFGGYSHGGIETAASWAAAKMRHLMKSSSKKNEVKMQILFVPPGGQEVIDVIGTRPYLLTPLSPRERTQFWSAFKTYWSRDQAQQAAA